jgi:serine/threonine-protein kinase
MSPEQARGKAVDRRADIWAFGCVLYEMLTARRAFAGDEVSDTLASVLAREPDWALLPATVPPVLGTYLRRCLHKEPRQRIHDIADVRLALEGAFETAPGNAGSRGQDPAYVHTQVDAAVAAVRRMLGRRLALVGAAAVVVTGGIVGATVWWTMRPAPPRVIRTEITTAGATALSISGFDRDLAITPDGSRVVYRSNNQLLVRALDQLEPHVLGGLGAPRGVFVSPDGQWVGFFDGTTMKRVALTGGPPLTITRIDGSGSRGATWGPDGTIVYATDAASTGLQRVSAAGGDPTVLTKPNRERGEEDHLWPEFLPGGQAVLFTISAATGGLDNAQIAVFDLETGTSKVLVRGGHHAHYVPTGHLVYGAGGTLRAVAFDRDRLEVAGTPVPVLEQVVTSVGGAVDAAVAANGTMVYVPGRGGPGAVRSLVWVDRMGREEQVPTPLRAYYFPRISPDGTRVALAVMDQEQDIWIWDFARERLTRFTFDPGADQYPLWSPDSRRLIFTSTRVGGSNVFSQAADGTGAVEQLTEGSTLRLPQAMTPDGNSIIVREVGQQDDLMLMPLQPPRRPQPLVQTMFSERNAEIVPDGRWLAYESDESGREEIYVRPFPDVSGGRWQVSTGGGRMPLWSRNGQELFYGAPDGALMGVRVEPGPSWRSSTPARILQGQFAYSGFGRAFDIAPDGRRFLMIREGGATRPRRRTSSSRTG